jgi:hypothetical protein
MTMSIYTRFSALAAVMAVVAGAALATAAPALAKDHKKNYTESVAWQQLDTNRNGKLSSKERKRAQQQGWQETNAGTWVRATNRNTNYQNGWVQTNAGTWVRPDGYPVNNRAQNQGPGHWVQTNAGTWVWQPGAAFNPRNSGYLFQRDHDRDGDH